MNSLICGKGLTNIILAQSRNTDCPSHQSFSNLYRPPQLLSAPYLRHRHQTFVDLDIRLHTACSKHGCFIQGVWCWGCMPVVLGVCMMGLCRVRMRRHSDLEHPPSVTFAQGKQSGSRCGAAPPVARLHKPACIIFCAIEHTEQTQLSSGGPHHTPRALNSHAFRECVCAPAQTLEVCKYAATKNIINVT